jgi:hypothetical protein
MIEFWVETGIVQTQHLMNDVFDFVPRLHHDTNLYSHRLARLPRQRGGISQHTRLQTIKA